MTSIFRVSLASFILLAGCAGTIPELGLDGGHLAPCPKTPNCVSSESSGDRHFIEPLQIVGTSLEAKNALLAVLRELNASNISTISDDYVRAEFTSKLFGYVDDVEFYIPARSSSGKKSVWVRSASRSGFSDFGVNRRRVELIREKLSALDIES